MTEKHKPNTSRKAHNVSVLAASTLVYGAEPKENMLMPVCENFTTAAPLTIAQFETFVPPTIAEAYKEHGAGYIEDGLVQLFNPAYTVDKLRPAAHINTNLIPAFSTDFGNIIYWSDLAFRLTSYRREIVDIIDAKPEEITKKVTDPEFTNTLGYPLYKQALERFQTTPDTDTCYTHAPLLTIGGTEDVKTLDPSDMWTHIQIIVQMCGYPKEVFKEALGDRGNHTRNDL